MKSKIYRKQQNLLKAFEEKDFNKFNNILEEKTRYGQLMEAVKENDYIKVKEISKIASDKEICSALEYAKHFHNDEIFDYLLSLDIKYDKWTFQQFIKHLDIKTIKYILNKQPWLFEDKGNSIFSEFSYNNLICREKNEDILNRQIELISFLIDEGFDPRDSKNEMPFLYLLRTISFDLLKKLYEFDFNFKNDKIIIYAIENKTLDKHKIIKWLLEIGIDPHYKDDAILKNSYTENIIDVLSIVDYSDIRYITKLKKLLVNVVYFSNDFDLVKLILSYHMKNDKIFKQIVKEDYQLKNKLVEAICSIGEENKILNFLFQEKILTVQDIMSCAIKNKNFELLRDFVKSGYLSWSELLFKIINFNEDEGEMEYLFVRSFNCHNFNENDISEFIKLAIKKNLFELVKVLFKRIYIE